MNFRKMFRLRKVFPNFKCATGLAVHQNSTFSTKVNTIPSNSRKMKGWQAHAYGDLEELQCSGNMKIPVISSSDEVLVRVNAAGVNPIDVAMLHGYGAKMFNIGRKTGNEIEFPLTFGREFSGIIVQKGLGSNRRLEIGQKVWGVVPLQRQGCHAEYVVVPESAVAEHPAELSSAEGSALLYSGLTAWSGLFLTSNFKGILSKCFSISEEQSTRPKRVLVLGAAGSVGSIAVQILKAEHATVIASCSADAFPLVQTLGVDHIIDYSDESSVNDFSECGPYDIILDCAGQGPDYAQKYGWQFKEYVTFSAPLLKNVDQHGLGIGMAKNITDIVEQNVKSMSAKQGCVKWAYFVPSLQGIEYLKKLVERKKLLPKVDSVFGFDETPAAYKRVQEGHLRGKVVINYENE